MDLGVSDSFGIPLDTLSHFVHPLNGLVRRNLVKQILAAPDNKLFGVYYILIVLLASQFLIGSPSNLPKYPCTQGGY